MAESDELEKRAIAEIMKEATLGAARASEVGPSGWKKCPLLKTNKRFLANTLVQHIGSNRRRRKESPRRKRSRSPDRNTSRNKDRVRNGRVEKSKKEESDMQTKHKSKKSKKDKKKDKKSKS